MRWLEFVLRGRSLHQPKYLATAAASKREKESLKTISLISFTSLRSAAPMQVIIKTTIPPMRNKLGAIDILFSFANLML